MRSSSLKVSGLLLLFIFFFSTYSYAVRYYVNYQAAGTGTGISWVNAFPTLTAAITKSVDGDEIWVARGSYYPGDARTNYFLLKSGVRIYGGFSGTESSLTERIAAANGLYTVNETILDGRNNSYHVVHSPVANTFLDGFSLQGGATLDVVANSANNVGAGLYAINSGTFQNLWIKSNTAGGAGAGVYNSGTGTFKNLVIESNVLNKAGMGTGIYNSGAASFQQITILNNGGASTGGGIHNIGLAIFQQITITNNNASTNGGGIYNTVAASFQQITLNNNNAVTSGGGMYNTGTNPQFTDIVFRANNSSVNGGGLFSTVAMNLDRVSFIENTSVRNGGGFYSTGVVNMTNTVFSRNSLSGVNAAYTGGGMYVSN
ncbi:MAG: hypothetical protein MUP99_07175, partial [Pedobacter sp.]|nr:hypothetical protein [Pedobacter sp.]